MAKYPNFCCEARHPRNGWIYFYFTSGPERLRCIVKKDRVTVETKPDYDPERSIKLDVRPTTVKWTRFDSIEQRLWRRVFEGTCHEATRFFRNRTGWRGKFRPVSGMGIHNDKRTKRRILVKRVESREVPPLRDCLHCVNFRMAPANSYAGIESLRTGCVRSILPVFVITDRETVLASSVTRGVSHICDTYELYSDWQSRAKKFYDHVQNILDQEA